eukprot:4606945-Prymnesium_polylepis.1
MWRARALAPSRPRGVAPTRKFCTAAGATVIYFPVQESNPLTDSTSRFGRRGPWRRGRVKVSATLAKHRGARGRRGRHTLTSRCHYYSTTSNWVKLFSVPELRSPELYTTAADEVYLLTVECYLLAKFN